MALTKIGKEGITGISNSADATFLTATSSEGVTLAGTLAVTGVHTIGNNAIYTSDGGAVTQNLVQGVAKMWCTHSQASSYTLDDSFNVASIADAGAGKTTININNDMANATYAVGGCCTQESVVIASLAAGSFEGRSISNDGSLTDSTDFTVLVQGDLA